MPLITTLTTIYSQKSFNYAIPSTMRAIFGYGSNFDINQFYMSMTNLVSNTGVVATDTAGVGTGRNGLAAAGYGGDKAIFGHGTTSTGSPEAITNLVSNTGVVATDTAGVGTARTLLAAAGYGTDKAIFAFGRRSNGAVTNLSNLVSNTGVVSTDTAGVGTARSSLAAAGYGNDKAIFAFGTSNPESQTAALNDLNLVSNTGVIANDSNNYLQTARRGLAAASYGIDKAIFAYGLATAFLLLSNKVSNTGIVATDTSIVGPARGFNLAAAGYGTDKAIFGFGYADGGPGQFNFHTNITNKVSNTGVVASQTAGVGSSRTNLAAASYGA
jgi:hypothetical protein